MQALDPIVRIIYMGPGLASCCRWNSSSSDSKLRKFVQMSRRAGIVILVQVLMLFQELGASEASAITDPEEVAILRSVSEKMGVVTLWNLDTDPCTTSPTTNDSYGGSYLGCDCSFDNGNTCHVTKIAIYRMNVKSELPAEIGGLKYLIFLDVNGNNLNGQIPPEIGNLKNLTHLGLGTNRFTGELPPELGNLIQLRDLFLDTNQLSGPIPLTLANLRKLQTLWMFNNNFSGSIPDIFENLTELQNLRIYGNPLQGSLPQSIKDLKSILEMYVGDVSNGGFFPHGLENLQSITALSLRNCELYGSISTKLGQLTHLTFLDLSFNRLTGSMPHTFRNLVSLQTLYLGRNNLSGGLLQELGQLSSLKYLDVSYNQLSGALPSWLNSPYINVNLIWNFFNSSNTVNVFSASYFNCHFSNTSCQRTVLGNNSEFAINVGGKEVKTSTSTYDDDSKVHGYTSFYTNDKRTWAVSQTGGFDQGNFLDIVNTTSEIQGTQYPSLYQTAHSSSSSLKYYGLEMKNGQYMVDLHFAEIVLTDGSLGTRIFDIFVQGVLIRKDFNIQDAAHGSLKAFVLSIPVMVSNNYLEIHFFWDGKGTCCYPRRWAYGPLVSAIRVYPASQFVSSFDKQRQTLAIAFSIIGAVLIALCLIAAWYWKVNNNPSILSTEDQAVRSFGLQQGVNLFSYQELRTATSDFSALKKLGEGGFGAVYKGALSDGTQVAVKMLCSRSKQGDREFLNEVRAISSVQQRNLVKLRGCCVGEGLRILVYEFIENNSLSQALFGKIPKDNAQGAVLLNWNTRFNIALGIARGLAYLHEESETCIIHRDIKASNILLDKNFNPKISDFGLARFFDDEKTHVSTRAAGTIGYMAPEYAFRGQLSEKADVFSYGVLMLETFSGRSNMDLSLPNEHSLLEWAWYLYENNHILDLMDSRLNGEYPSDIALRVLEVSLMCTQAAPSARPSMSRVMAMLLGDVKVPPLECKPVFVTDVRLQKATANAIQSVGSNSNSASIATFSTVVESR